MKLYNSRTRKIEEFKSIEVDHVKMYSCGPTVYDYVHIGNLRAFTFADLLKKTLKFSGYNVRHVMNITDFGHLVGDTDDGEDKMSVGLKREGLPRTLEGMKKLADKYIEIFISDISKINIALPDEMPKASENIEEYIKIINGLDSKGFVYKTSDGLYFDTSKDANYGFMSLLKNSSHDEGRIAMNNEKKNPADFALWKFADSTGIGFPSTHGFGFPGWHIECSGMAIKYLGETFDIHTGGIDLMSIHHTNEIAQSENYTGKIFSNFFCHNEFINIDEQKMSKSKNNYFTLNTILQHNFSPLSFRYFLLQSHYRQNNNFTWEALEASQTALNKLKKQVEKLEKSEEKEVHQKYIDKFTTQIQNDINTPQALATLWTLLKDKTVSDNEKYWTIKKFDEVFSLGL